MKVALLVGLALVLLSIESVVVKTLGLEVTRIDVCMALVAFVAVRSSITQGALAAFGIGYLLDVFTGRPSGLFPALAVLMFLVLKAAAQLVDGKSRLGFVLFSLGATLGHSLLAFLFTWLTSRSGEGRVLSLSGLPLQAVLTAATAAALFPLLVRLEPGERVEGGSLR